MECPACGGLEASLMATGGQPVKEPDDKETQEQRNERIWRAIKDMSGG